MRPESRDSKFTLELVLENKQLRQLAGVADLHAEIT